MALGPCSLRRGPKSWTWTGLYILTAKATGLEVVLASTNKTKKISIFAVSQIPTNMDCINWQVYTRIRSADKLCVSHTVAFQNVLSFVGMEMCGFRGARVVWICFLVKFSLKPNPSCLHPNVHSDFFPQRKRWREMCKSSIFSLERKDKD